jgi:hypothetical protein
MNNANLLRYIENRRIRILLASYFKNVNLTSVGGYRINIIMKTRLSRARRVSGLLLLVNRSSSFCVNFKYSIYIS